MGCHRWLQAKGVKQWERLYPETRFRADLAQGCAGREIRNMKMEYTKNIEDPNVGDEVYWRFVRTDSPGRYFIYKGRLLEVNGSEARVKLQFDEPRAILNGSIETIPFDSLYRLDPK